MWDSLRRRLPVNEAFGFEILHAVANLNGEVAQGEHRKAGTQRGFLEALQQRAQRRKFRHQHETSGVQHDAKQSDDVFVVDRMHYRGFLEEFYRVRLHPFSCQTLYGDLRGRHEV